MWGLNIQCFFGTFDEMRAMLTPARTHAASKRRRDNDSNPKTKRAIITCQHREREKAISSKDDVK
jgi:hypothetical protein